MAHSIEHLIEETPKGVKIELGTLYCYGYGDKTMFWQFPDAERTSWPMHDPLEAVSIIVDSLLYPMIKAAEAKAKKAA